MTNEPQSQHAGVVAAHSSPITDRAASGDTDEQARATASIPEEERGVAWVSMEIYARQQARLRELENEVEALSKQLESVIMALSRTFGSGQAALQKVK